MKIGIAGLGLIGGSLAKAYKASGAVVYGVDADAGVQRWALMCGALDGVLDETALGVCDCVFIALYPAATVAYLEKNAALFRKNGFVVDCCGIKRQVCGRGFALARENGFRFFGGHPMAGTQYSGFAHSKADMFAGANMVLVPPENTDIRTLESLKKIIVGAGFSSVSVTDAASHDEIIAYTSQLAHVVSNAYVKSPTAQKHHGFSAGSYRDLTRVAKLSEDMWSELFIENGDNLLKELDGLIASLSLCRDAIAEKDREALRALLKEGRIRKEETDG